MLSLQPGPRATRQNPPLPQVIYFDVDNTLVPNESTDLPTARFALAAQQASRTATLALATARPLAQVKHILDFIKAQGLSILSNGAQIYDGRTGVMVAERTLPTTHLRGLITGLSNLGVAHVVQDNGTDYWPNSTTAPPRIGHFGAYRFSTDPWGRSKHTELIERYIPAKPLVLVAKNVEVGQLLAVQELAQKRSQFARVLIGHEHAANDGRRLYEVFFLHPEADKRNALREAAKLSGIALEQTAAVGDGPNDADLLEAVGMGIAMGNAVEQTLAVAQYIAPRREDDGAAVVLETLFGQLPS